MAFYLRLIGIFRQAFEFGYLHTFSGHFQKSVGNAAC